MLNRPRAVHRHRSREDLRRIQRSSDKTLPLPPQPTLRIYIESNPFLKMGQQKNPAPISRPNSMRPPLVFRPRPEHLFLLSTYAFPPILARRGRNFSRFLML